MTNHKNALRTLSRDMDFADAFNELLNEMILPLPQDDGFPHYDIVKYEDTGSGVTLYNIDVAVAGYDRDDLSVTYEDNAVVISGKKGTGDRPENTEYVHRGIAKRSFSKKFHLNPEIVVDDVNLNSGILTVRLFKKLPEEKRPRMLEIN